MEKIGEKNISKKVYDNTIDQEKYDSFGAIYQQLQDIEDVIKEAFGDGVQITVTKDGVDVVECRHD